MSTAGKVLSVLVMLVAAVWLLLSAAVTQLNRNGARAVLDLQKQVAQLETDFQKARADLRGLKDATTLEQAQTQSQLNLLLQKQADAEKVRSQVKEILTRVQLQVQDVEANVERSQTLSSERTAEREAETKAKAEAEAEVEKLKGENAELLEKLTGLREKFKATWELNRSLVRQAAGAAAPTGARTVARPVSVAR
jgi:hypothetical protein